MTRVVAILAAVLTLAACSSGSEAEDEIVAAQSGPTQTLYIVGTGTSVGSELPDSLRQAWPRVLFDAAFPPATILVNGATGPSTVARALTEQLPLARELSPEIVAVWLGSYDLNQGTDATDFGRDLRTLLDALRAAGAERVLVADLPRLPAYDEALRLAYNDAIAEAAQGSGSVLVELADLDIEAVDDEADYQPDVAGHRAVATAFADALVASGLP